LLFLQTILMDLVLTKPSGPKCHTVVFATQCFAMYSVFVTQIIIGGGGGRVGGAYSLELSWSS
jgi:hypothetical protein